MSNPMNVSGCESEDVIEFHSGMYRVSQLTSAFERQLSTIASQICSTLNQSDKIAIPPQVVYTAGVDCQVLGVNSKGWKKGKVKVKFELEFIPEAVEEVLDEGISIPSTESPLDSLRLVDSK